jgi:diguanylate cyclase (GGDEF)-like protein
MSASALAVAAVALASFYSLWWCLSLARRLRRIERTSKLDPLTGLGSGDWLHAERWPAALRSGRPLGVVYLDLDHLKLTNDSLGHSAGDQYIRTAADALSHAVRRGVDEIFRCHQAGDEFEVILHGPISDLSRCARSLLQRLSDRGVSASLGLAYTTVTEFVPARAELRRLAEVACRQAKKQGGGCAMLAGLGLVTASAVQNPDCPDSAGLAGAIPPSAHELSPPRLSGRHPSAEVGSL